MCCIPPHDCSCGSWWLSAIQAKLAWVVLMHLAVRKCSLHLPTEAEHQDWQELLCLVCTRSSQLLFCFPLFNCQGASLSDYFAQLRQHGYYFIPLICCQDIDHSLLLLPKNTVCLLFQPQQLCSRFITTT